jgi:hypothetical protein
MVLGWIGYMLLREGLAVLLVFGVQRVLRVGGRGVFVAGLWRVS